MTAHSRSREFPLQNKDRDLGRTWLRSQRESHRDPGEISAAGNFIPSENPGRIPRDSRREEKIPVAKILQGSCRKSCQDSRWETKIPAAKILPRSCCKSRQDSRRETNSRWPNLARIPYANLYKILIEKQIPGSQNLGVTLPGILPKFAAGSEIPGKIHCGNLGKILEMLRQISFGAKVLQIKVKLPCVYVLDLSS